MKSYFKVRQLYNQIQTSNKHIFIFWSTLIFYFISIFNLNNKTVYLSCLLLWGVYYWRLKNLRSSLVLTTIVSLIFTIGKTWEFQLITPFLLQTDEYPKGYTVFLTITPFNILSFFILVFLIRDWLKNVNSLREKLATLFKQWWFIFLFSFFVWPIIGAIFSKNLYNLPLSYALKDFSYFILFISLIIYKISYSQIYYLFGAMTVFESGLVIGQWLKKSTLGLIIESTQQFLTYQRAADQGFFSIRPIGTFTHANELAVFGIIMTLFFLPVLYLKVFKQKKLPIIFLVSSIINLGLSLGRSAWISVFFLALPFFYIVEKRWRRKTIFSQKIKRRHLIYIVILCLLTMSIVFPRIIKGFDFFQPSGGSFSRGKLVEESWRVILQQPLWGVGKGLTVLEMLRVNSEGIISFFPAPVHNFYLLIASESGLPVLMFFILMILLLIKKILRNFASFNKDDKIKWLGTVMAILALLINSLANFIFLIGFFVILLFILQKNETTNS